MRYAKDHKEATRKKILDAASRLFREKGYDGIGVDAIMNEAGLTAGGVYISTAKPPLLPTWEAWSLCMKSRIPLSRFHSPRRILRSAPTHSFTQIRRLGDGEGASRLMRRNRLHFKGRVLEFGITL